MVNATGALRTVSCDSYHDSIDPGPRTAGWSELTLAFPHDRAHTIEYHLDPVQGPAGGRFRDLLPLPILVARFLISGEN